MDVFFCHYFESSKDQIMERVKCTHTRIGENFARDTTEEENHGAGVESALTRVRIDRTHTFG